MSGLKHKIIAFFFLIHVLIFSIDSPRFRYAGWVVEVFPDGLVTLHMYTLLLSPPTTGEMTKVGVVVPWYLPPDGRLVLFPNCHWYEMGLAPAAVMVKLTP